LAVGLTAWRSMIRQPGLAMMHLGCLLVIAGAMWGSDKAHELRSQLAGRAKPPHGSIILAEGETFNELFLVEPGKKPRPVGKLNFSLQAKRVWTEYYPPESPRWQFHYITRNEADKIVKSRLLDCKPGETVKLPDETGFRVLEYWTDDDKTAGPRLLISDGGAETVVMPAIVGEERRIAAIGAVVKVVRRFGNFRLRENAAGRSEPIDAPGGWNPALELECISDNGKTLKAFAFTPSLAMKFAGHQPELDILMMYLPPPPERHGRLAPSAVLLEFTRGQTKTRGWLAAGERSSHEVMRIPTVGQATTGQHPPELVIAKPHQEVRDYKVDIAVLDNQGRQVAREIIEVNSPLHHGGYHFCLSEFIDGEYPLLLVRSDNGLYCVYIGFAMLMTGMVLQLWARPIWRTLRRGRTAK
ncbi:MAG: cytochrome c biogenesis protein ResB, partial [Phycisphaerae bacterium]|nr:cytochrome c biogenesis protein ResB [Phycisphaerae bacterium]